MFQTVNSWDLAKSIRDPGWNDDTVTSAGTVSVRAAEAQTRSLTPTEQYELSIAVNAAVNAICRNLSKAKVRLFTRTGREITGGACFDLFRMPAPKFAQRKLLWEISAWLNIAGEFFINLVPDSTGKPTQMLPLAPTHIRVVRPAGPVNTRNDVIQWEYAWSNGTKEAIRDDYVCFERLFNPNPRSIRGLSPLVTGAVQVSGAYYAERYNKQFFENNAIPSHIINVGEGVPKVQREAFTREYLQSYSNYGNNAHKVAVVAGSKSFDVSVLEQPFQDGAFMEMMKRGDLKVGQLYRVPAVNMGIYDKTRFDTANEERKLFLEETLEPQAELIGEALQFQVVDPFFANTAVATGKKVKDFPRGLQKSFEKAEAGQGRGILLLVDTDALPIRHEVQLAKTEHAIKLREAYDISAKAAEEYVGMEFDDNRPEREEIFVPNNRVCITNPKLNEMLIPGIKSDGAPDKGADKGADSADTPSKVLPDPSLAKAAQNFVRKVRRLTFDALDAQRMWSLADGDKLAGDERLKPLVRHIRHNARKLGAKDAIKQFLNDLDPTQYLHAA